MSNGFDKETPIALFWHRRDLRVFDNTGLFHALGSGLKVLPVFIFDTDILSKLENKQDARVHFIYENLLKLKGEYEKHQCSLLIKIGKPEEVLLKLLDELNVKAVYTNNDYEPYAKERDKKVDEILRSKGIEFRSFKDHVIFEKDEVLKADGKPYTVFTPYMRRWKERIDHDRLTNFPSQSRLNSLVTSEALTFPTLEEIGFKETHQQFPSVLTDLEIIRNYNKTRDLPAIKGTTRLGVHLRFGTISIREMVSIALKSSETWLNELIWREFFKMILFHFPHTVDKAFKPAYGQIEWLNYEKHFEAWCQGKTGFPIVDAGMRELTETGFMHNRVRMIAGSFLVKDLLIDWRCGEAWFAEKLLDYEQASNVGNWQWVAGSGCDAAPYFRVFNPILQAQKFDPSGKYIRRWVPELGTPAYPTPIVDHAIAKERAIKAYKKALANG
ncbi:MAG: deoxyribodipyrimidine photo-lyase [Bacteroidales bacterium]|nr:deoxyribodipyrimidine photo-lyase [Bacteroidales bacterium]